MSVVRFRPEAPKTKPLPCAGVAQLAEQLICNQQVAGSIPVTSSIHEFYTEGFPSGQREQTVNLSSATSVVRIHPLPPQKALSFNRDKAFCYVCRISFSNDNRQYKIKHLYLRGIILFFNSNYVIIKKTNML